MSEIELAPDVLVVGGGIAGALAAARARELGAKVTLVKKPGGGTPASSGAIDVADDVLQMVPGPAFDPLERGGRWRKAADVVAAVRPRHPYARCGDKSRERLREALSLLKQLTVADGAVAVDLVERDDGLNHVLATQLGTVKRAALVQKSQWLDVASFDHDVLVGVVEPLDLGGWSARSAVHMLSWILGMSARRVQLTTVVVERTLSGREVLASPFEMALRMDDPAYRGPFVDALKAGLRKQARTLAHVLVPPVLGVEKGQSVWQDVERAIARPVREVLALPQSAPGERLNRALHAGLNKMGVVVVEGAAIEAAASDRRATSVTIEGTQLRLELKPKAVVLAGGRFFGGGLVRNGDAREALFGLPVVTNGGLVADSFIGDHLAELPEGEHAIFRAGVAVDENMRPLDASGRVALENVMCAGSLVEGWDPARDGTGGAVATWTGFLAGERAARHARG